jgi:ABC-2 type transport system ATP-binding protein
MTAPAIELQQLRKTFRKGRETVVAVDGLDLRVECGEVFGLLGPNGAGKTTTVEICEGLQRQDHGVVRILGQEWGRGADAALRARLGVCLQETRFHDKQTVRETVALFAAFVRGGRSVDEVLDLVALRDKASARQKDLSGGQRQRLAVATALLGTPELLFLDEPTTGLDPQSRRQLWEIVRDYQQRGGSVVLTTHYMDEAYQLCDRVGVVDRGRLIALGTPDELIRSLGAAQFVAFDVDRLDGVVTRDELAALPGVAHCTVTAASAELTVASVHTTVPPLLELLASRRVELLDLSTRRATLEDVFVHLTGRHLREGA